VGGSGVDKFVLFVLMTALLRFHRAVDASGNTPPASGVVWYLDTVPPPPPVFTAAPDKFTLQSLASFTVSIHDDSPGTPRVVYTLVDEMGDAISLEGTVFFLATIFLVWG
jgi:hypothetical protein